MKRLIRTYCAPSGRAPYEDWLNNLKDATTRARIKVRIDRASLGNLGDHKSVGGGVVELRIHYGPGYRVYLGLHGNEIIVLLCGGDKSSQGKDIEMAREFWNDYRRRL